MTTSSPSGPLPYIEKYELVEEIGHGGMATVYRARDLRLGREVAVKIIHKHLRENPEVRRRFVAEARAVAKLRHPCIVEVYDVSDEADIERYLVVELVRGTTLRDMLRRHPELPAEIGASIAALLCDAVEHAHQCGVIHRDIKPENVLIELPVASEATSKPQLRSDPPGAAEAGSGRRDSSRRSSDHERLRIKLTDFGIAKILDAQGVTSTGQILGSPAHMAPEQIEAGAVVPATDVFALGVLFYECMVGHLPFEGTNPAQVLRRVMEGKYEPADAERPLVGGRWARIVARALERDCTRRIQTAAGFAELIRAELTALGVSDARRGIADYFADPDAYRARQAAELPPRLLERGEQARRQHLVHGAAADFNRALAFRPDDLQIMRRVSALSAQTAWRRRGLRFALIAALSGLHGAGAFGITRWLRSAEGATTNTAAPTSATTPEPSGTRPNDTPSALVTVGPDSATAAPRSSVPESASASATISASASSASASAASASARVSSEPTLSIGPPPSSSLDPTRSSDTRPVTFVVVPGGVKFTLDSQVASWQSTFPLKVGSLHTVAISGARCCESLQTSFTVKAAPSDAPDQPLVITYTLKPLPATVSLVGGPPGSSVTCLRAGVDHVGRAPMSVTLTEAALTDTCTFLPGNKTRPFPFHAGEHNGIPWPGD